MLYQIPHTRQTNQHHVKRWFTSCDMDLFVWFRNNTLLRFQLAYDKGNEEKAVSWHDYSGFSHYLVTLAGEFLASSKNIDSGIADFIYARLMAYPTTTAKHRATNTGRLRAT